MTVHDDDLFADLAMFRNAPVPEAGPALRELFASVATIPTVEPARRLPVYKRILTGLPSKVAAGALGALLAGSVGAGALTGTFVLTSDDDDPAAVCVEEVAFEDAEPAVDDDSQGDVVADADADADADDADECAAADADAADADAADDDDVDEPAEEPATDDDAEEAEEPAAAELTDPAAVPVPTSQSEAAQTHVFDEACGNHGAYVSHFAHTGEEPECATAAGVGTEPAEAAPEATTKAEARSEHKATKADARSAKKSNRSDKGGR